MKIIYVTTAIERDDYKEFSKLWKTSLNPSNQNFHNKMIRALAINNQVDVISIRPFSTRFCNAKVLAEETKVEGNITWHYIKIKGNKFTRPFIIKKEVNRLMKKIDTEGAVIISDTINPNVIKNTNNIVKKYKIPAIGVLTDSPSNISGTPRSYTLYLLNQGKNLDGYIALTDGLNDLFNENEKPHIIMEGIVEDLETKPTPNKYGKYFFFGGALLERYGVYNLIEAFNKLNSKDINLLICGHHGDDRRIKEAIGGNHQIHYLKTLPVKEVLELEAGAFANINPRPYSQDLDRFSIPSKTIEYYTSGQIAISADSTKLNQYFNTCTVWCGYAKVDELLAAMNKVIKMDEDKRIEMGKKAKIKAQELYSLSSVNKKLNQFLAQFVK